MINSLNLKYMLSWLDVVWKVNKLWKSSGLYVGPLRWITQVTVVMQQCILFIEFESL